MSAERRIDRMEQALPATEATLLWLSEAHACGSLTAYVAWLREQPLDVAPYVRIPEQARHAARAAYRGSLLRSRIEAEKAAIRDGLFLVELVLVLERSIEETMRLAALQAAALFWEMRALGAAEWQGRDDVTWWTSLGSRVETLQADLLIVAAAREWLEARYLRRCSALFPDTDERWGRLVETVAGLVWLATTRGGHPGAPRVPMTPPEPAVAAETARILDEARWAALHLMEEHDAATVVADRLLDGGMAPPDPPQPVEGT